MTAEPASESAAGLEERAGGKSARRGAGAVTWEIRDGRAGDQKPEEFSEPGGGSASLECTK
jgi:hypothetical protein